MSKNHHGRAWVNFAREVVAHGRSIDAPCCRCGRSIDYTLPGSHLQGPTADHLTMLMHGGDLIPSLAEMGVAHRLCNSRHGSRMMHAGKKRLRIASPLPEPPTQDSLEVKFGVANAVWTGDYVGDGGPFVAVGGELPALWADCEWMIDVSEPGDNGTWPRLMSGPHPRAVGSRGPEVVSAIEERRGADPLTPSKQKRLRWWQKLVLYRMYEVDAKGQLCWRKVLISTSRQVGKSVGLREIALHRITEFDLYEEPQLVMHVAKDLAVADEIQRPARQWALMQGFPWHAFGASGRWAVENTGIMGRWLIRSQEGVYGYSVSLAMIDEAWAISATTISEGIEPTMIEREQPQMLMVSTAHRAATSLFPSHRVPAIGALDDPQLDVLLVEWSAPQGADKHHVAAHRMASPYWDERRANFIASKVELPGFEEQWLNIWPDVSGKKDMLAPKEIIDFTMDKTVKILHTTEARTFVIYPDTAQTQWHVLAGGLDKEGVTLIQYVDGYNSLAKATDYVRGEAKRGIACDLLVPRHVKGRIPRIPGVRRMIWISEADVAAATSAIRPLLISGRVRHSGHATLRDQMTNSALETYGETVRISHKVSEKPVEAAKAAMLVGWWAGRQDKPGAVVV